MSDNYPLDNAELTPETREETFLDGVTELEPETRKEAFIAKIYDSSQVVPMPRTETSPAYTFTRSPFFLCTSNSPFASMPSAIPS